MMSFSRRALALFFFFTILFSSLKAYGEDASGKVVILFDHSVTNSKYNPRVISKVWLEIFLKSFKRPYDITLAGFDDIITEHFRAVVRTDEDKKSARGKAEMVVNGGFTADFETPLAYLVDRQENEPLLFAVVITDGKPEIWNKKKNILSQRVKFDFRYDDINEKFNGMRAKLLPPEDIYNQLNNQYQDRNVELIEKKLVVFTQELAEKIIFIDLSNQADQLREWADIAGTHYADIKKSVDKSPAERLKTLIYSIEELAGKKLGEELPNNYKEIVDKVIGEEPELALLRSLSRPAHSYVKEKEKKPTIRISGGINAVWLMSLIFGLAPLPFIAVFFFRRKDGDENDELDIEFDDKGTLESLASEVKAVELPSLPSLEPLPSFNRQKKELEPKPVANAVNLFKKPEPEYKLEFKPSDINLSLRVLVPAGMMEAYWRNNDGNIVSESVLSISLDRVHFKARSYNGSLQRVKSEKFNVEFRVTDSHSENVSASEAVVVIDSFNDDAITRMNWIGLLADIDDINY